MDFDEDDDYSRISLSCYPKREDDFDSFTFLESITDATGPQWKQAVISVGHRAERFAIGIFK